MNRKLLYSVICVAKGELYVAIEVQRKGIWLQHGYQGKCNPRESYRMNKSKQRREAIGHGEKEMYKKNPPEARRHSTSDM